MRTPADGRCALHAISQVLRGTVLTSPHDPLIADLGRFYPAARRRIDHLYRTGEYTRDQFDVSNPQVFHEFITNSSPWVTHVVVLDCDGTRCRHPASAAPLGGAALAVTALLQGYARAHVHAIQRRTAAVFIHRERHWVAAIPAEHVSRRQALNVTVQHAL